MDYPHEYYRNDLFQCNDSNDDDGNVHEDKWNREDSVLDENGAVSVNEGLENTLVMDASVTVALAMASLALGISSHWDTLYHISNHRCKLEVSHETLVSVSMAVGSINLWNLYWEFFQLSSVYGSSRFHPNHPSSLYWNSIKISFNLFTFKINFETKLTLHKLGDMAFLLVAEPFFFFPLDFRLLLAFDAEEVGRLHGPRRSGPLKSQWTFFNSWTLSEKS